MEWATRGKYLDGSFFVEVQSGGNVDIVRLSELGTRGLPMPESTKRRVVVTDFATWHQAFSAEYQGTFGITAVSDGHQVFEFTADGRRYIVPALALMRGLFRPNRHVLAEMFKPHGLERSCTPVMVGSLLTVSPMQSWLGRTKQATASMLRPLAWMYSFPSARKMCGAVHEAMLAGRIGLSLPIGRVRMVVQAQEDGLNSYVTSLVLITLDTDEAPYEFTCQQSKHIEFHGSVSAATGRAHGQATKDPSIAYRPDGSIYISDEEWCAIEKLFASRKISHKLKHHPRLLLDGILAKLSSGTTWQKATYKVGSCVNASALFQQLTASGSWREICRTLQQLRTTAAN